MGFSSDIPSKDRVEWRLIVTGKLDYKFSNLVLQMKSTEYAQSIQGGEIDSKKAIDELHDLCSKYSLAVREDLIKIFRRW